MNPPGSADAFRPGLWPSVVKLFRLRLHLFWIGFLHARLMRKIGMLILTLVILGALVAIFVVSWGMLAFLRTHQIQAVFDATPFLLNLPALILTGAFIGLALTSFGVLLQGLYLAKDMDFLLSAPLPMRAVFLTKMVQAILPNFGLILLLGLPVLYGMGFAEGFSPLYFILIPLVFLALALSAAGLSSLLVMGIVRIFPARRVAEVLAFLGAVFSILCSQTGQFTNRFNMTGQDLSGATQTFSRLNSPYNPLAWAGNGLVEIMQGRWLAGLGQVLLFLALAGGVFYLALVSAEKLYYTGWARMQVGSRRKKVARPTEPAVSAERSQRLGLAALFPTQIRGMLTKDWLVIRRDLRNFSQLITPLILGVVYGILLFGNQGQTSQAVREAQTQVGQAIQSLFIYTNIGLSLFVGWTLQSRLALMSFSSEGKAYWLIKTAPVSSSRLLLSKFLMAYIPTLALGWLFLVVISILQRSSLVIFLFGLAVVALSIAGAIGVNLAFGVAGARLDWDDPRHMLPPMTGCLSALVGFAYLAVNLACFFGPPLVVDFFGLENWIGLAGGLVLGGIVSIFCAIYPPWISIRKVARIGEN